MTEPTPEAPRHRRWPTILLVASLGLNLAFVGLAAGFVLRGPPPPGEVGLWRYGAALPEPHRGALAAALRESRGEWMAPRRALRAQRAALAAALVAEPYNPAAVADVLAAERRMLGALADRGTDLLLAEIGRMDAAERRAFAEALRRRPEHGGRR
jgi:uncharacterized membrane protein